MEFFSEFKWAIPYAFADALGKCQFAEGDVLYLNKAAYKKQFDAQSVGAAFQVLYPERQRTAPKEEINKIFEKNWHSEVRVQEYAVESPSSDRLAKKGSLVTTTQGRLYTAMWKGDASILDMNVAPPEMPCIDTKELVRLIEIQPEIKKNGVIIQERITETRLGKSESVALKRSGGRLVFSLPFDRANETSYAKYRSIHSIVKNDIEEEPILLSAKEAGLNDLELIRPTLKVALFVMSTNSRKNLEEMIKKATYTPAKNKKTDRVAYDIRRHCSIFDAAA